MIDWVATRDAVADILRTKVNIVHGYPRLEIDNQFSRWRKLMSDTRRINAWTILRSNMSNRFGTCKQIYATTNVMLVGMLQHDDASASQDEFDALIDSVLEVFFEKFRLRENIDIQGPAQLLVEELRQVDSNPVHYCEITFQVQQTVQI